MGEQYIMIYRRLDDIWFNNHLYKSQTTHTILHHEEFYSSSYDTLDFVPKVGKLGGGNVGKLGDGCKHGKVDNSWSLLRFKWKWSKTIF